MKFSNAPGDSHSGYCGALIAEKWVIVDGTTQLLIWKSMICSKHSLEANGNPSHMELCLIYKAAIHVE